MSGETLFRKSSMDRLRSPEQLNEYIRVARPGVWVILAAIILLLIGVVVWGVFGTIHTVVQAGAYVENGKAVCYISEEDAAAVQVGMPVSVRDFSGTVKGISSEPVQAGGQLHPYILQAAGLEQGGFCREVELDISGLGDGVYPAQITVESIRPITFVIQ